MANYAILKNNIVVNIIVWDGDESIWQPESGFNTAVITESDFVDMGYIYDPANNSFSAPPETE